MTADDGSIPTDRSEDGPDARHDEPQHDPEDEFTDKPEHDPEDEFIDKPEDDPEGEFIEQLRLLDPVEVETLRSSRSPEAMRMLEEILDTADDDEPETGRPHP